MLIFVIRFRSDFGEDRKFILWSAWRQSFS